MIYILLKEKFRVDGYAPAFLALCKLNSAHNVSDLLSVRTDLDRLDLGFVCLVVYFSLEMIGGGRSLLP